ncbi:MAG: class IV adenylate cyclase [Phycisphaerae bacterium]
MPREVEIKIPIDDARAIHARLAALGALRRGRVLETNRMFDTPERRLVGADEGLRLRTTADLDGGGAHAATLTFKGPNTGGALKSREEIETRVADAEALARLLERIGFAMTVTYQKRREEWTLLDCVVAIDELPRLGWWIEVEGPDESAVMRVVEQLGMDAASGTRANYVEMTARSGERSADGARVLLF